MKNPPYAVYLLQLIKKIIPNPILLLIISVKGMNTLKIIFLFILLGVFTLGGCEQSTDAGKDKGGKGIIVPGISVEGVKLGDSRETLVAKIGKPSSVGYADGLYRGWLHYTYSEGTRFEPHVKLQFYFIDKGNDFGPVDWIGIGELYNGKTKEGIGIGSTLEKVHEVYGFPAETFLSEDIITEKYCLNGKKLELGYRDSLIIGMSTGYFVPMPQDNPCK